MRTSKKNLVYLLAAFVITLSACTESKSPIIGHILDMIPVPSLIKQNVILTSGFDFFNKKLVSIDPTTGKEVPICGSNDNLFVNYDSIASPKFSQEHQDKHITNPCPITQIVNAPNTIKDAITYSKDPVEGHIKVDGVDKKATFFVTVTALFPGSHCVTTYSAGTQRTNCINREAQCAAIRAATRNPNYPC